MREKYNKHHKCKELLGCFRDTGEGCGLYTRHKSMEFVYCEDCDQQDICPTQVRGVFADENSV